MTRLLEAASVDTAQERMDAAPRRRGSAWARWRVAVRLAWRQTWRTKGSSALVVTLVALPVAGLAGAAAVWQAQEGSLEQRIVALELGANQTWIEAIGGPDPSRRQAIDQPWDNRVDADDSGLPLNPALPAPTTRPDVVPGDATVYPVQQFGSAAVETEAGVAWLTTVAGEVWAPSFAGLYVPIDGAAPTRADEFMATPGALERMGAEIGDAVVFPAAGATLTLTGTMRPANADGTTPTLFLPDARYTADGPAISRWYVADWQPGVDELAELNHAGYIAYARDLVLDPPADSKRGSWVNGTPLWSVMLIGAIIAAICGYIVVLLAGAAFSVAARRQQRALSVAASVGAARGDVFRVVVLQGTVLGVVGGLVGSTVGLGGAAVMLALTDRGAVGTFWGHFGFSIPWQLVAPIIVFAVIVGTIAAIAPARAATRGDTLAALRGARRPALLKPHRPLWGILVMIVGLVALVTGGVYVAATTATGGDTTTPVFYVAIYAVVLGPLLFQIGMLIPSHWVLVQLSKVASRLGLAPRLASRDAAANPSRVVPAFAVIGACIYAASFVLSMTAMTAAGNARMHWYQSPQGSLSVQLWQSGSDSSAELMAVAEDLVASTSPATTAVIHTTRWPAVDAAGLPLTPDAIALGVARQSYDWCLPGCTLGAQELASTSLSVVEATDVETVLGVPVDSAALATLEAGGAIVTDPGFLTAGDDVVVTEWTAGEYLALMQMDASSKVEPEAKHPLSAVFVDPGHQQPYQVVVTPRTAERLGAELVPTAIIATYDEPLPAATVDRITAQTFDFRVAADAGLNANVETGPGPVDPWLWLITGVTMALVVAASGVCLGLARFERRPDDATLTAVGGSRLLRRSVNAWQAAIIVGVGAIVGTTTGALSVWGYARANADMYRLSDTPWPWLAVLAIALPVAVTAVAWLVPPRHPDLTRRTAIT
ncbi:FtsX-like permease family protein [Microbacterium sp. NPDC056044]|uniref:FtsX-like permease family protein n=1 Tax=Microbacterium sp. NPDC056044 TaxID=3345690 RepID=UPI0035DD6861